MSWTYNPLRPCPIGHWRCGRFLWQGPFGSFCWWGFGSLNFDNLRFRRADWLLNYLVWWCCFQNGTMIPMTAIFLCLFSTFWREEATPFSLSLFLSLSFLSLSLSQSAARGISQRRRFNLLSNPQTGNGLIYDQLFCHVRQVWWTVWKAILETLIYCIWKCAQRRSPYQITSLVHFTIRYHK